MVQNELVDLNMQRQFMDKAAGVINGNQRVLNHGGGMRFLVCMRTWYGHTMAMAYLRQHDVNADSASLRVLLEELLARPTTYALHVVRPWFPQVSATSCACVSRARSRERARASTSTSFVGISTIFGKRA